MMLSYATLLVGSLSCVSFLIVDKTQGWGAADKALGFLDGLVDGGEGEGESESNSDAAVLAADAVKVNPNRVRPIVGDAGALAAEFPDAALIENSAPVGGDRLLREMDNLAYRCLGAGFALLTAGLISGAVWANEAWGSYWSWDPKETWALITWLFYAIYLHGRIYKDWSPKTTAAVSSSGFVIVWICYVGVNLFGVGLHSYGFFSK